MPPRAAVTLDSVQTIPSDTPSLRVSNNNSIPSIWEMSETKNIVSTVINIFPQ